MPQRQVQSGQLIRATTPTSAGFAQVFDTSGIVRMQQQKAAMKDKRLQDLMGEYDTKGTWKRDDAEVQRTVAAVQNYAMQNAEALNNPAQNMDVWREFQELQSDAKNTITYSIAAKKQFDSGMKTYMNGAEGRYLNDTNKDLLYDYSETPTAEQYADKSAWRDPAQGYLRNTKIDPTKYSKLLTSSLQDTPPEMEGTLTEGKGIVREGKYLDRKGSEELLRPIWDQGGLESGDLHQIHGQGEDGFQTWVDSVEGMVNVSPEYSTTTLPGPEKVKEKTAAEAKAEFAVVRRTGSGHTSIETKFTEGGKLLTYTDDSGEKQDAIQNWGLGTVGGEDNVMMFQPDLRITKNVTDGQDMTTGKMLKPGEGKRYKYQIPLERATYMTARKKIEYTYTDENGKKVKNVFEAGEALPDFEKMYRDGVITKNQFNDIASKSDTEDGYIVYASNEQIDYFDRAEGEDIMNILQGKGGRLLRVPAYTISPEVDQQLSYKHKGKTQADYGHVEKPKQKHDVMNLD